MIQSNRFIHSHKLGNYDRVPEVSQNSTEYLLSLTVTKFKRFGMVVSATSKKAQTDEGKKFLWKKNNIRIGI